jgi:hypothetical protein
MTRSIIYGIILCIGLLLMPTVGISEKVKEVKVVNTPSVTVTPESMIEVTVPQDKPLPVIITPEAKIPVTVSSVYQFVGYSNDTIRPTGGIAEMYSVCQRTYGASARMCTTKEFWNSPDLYFETEAWIQPTIVGYTLVRESTGPYEDHVLWIVDFIGAQMDIRDANCAQWTSRIESRGLVVSSDNKSIWPTYCSRELQVTCCLPATP